MITQSVLSEKLKTCKILKPAVHRDGYYFVTLCKNSKRKMHYIHRLVAMNFIANPENKQMVDHRDGNKQNNNVANLRWATNQENQRNAKLPERNTSGIKGVAWHKRDKRWRARVTINNVDIHLGYFKTLEEAKEARQNKINEVFGEYANGCEK